MRWASVVVFSVGCASSQVVPTSESLRAAELAKCEERMNWHIDHDDTCLAAETGSNAEPSCQAAYRRPISLGCRK